MRFAIGTLQEHDESIEKVYSSTRCFVLMEI